MEQPPTPTLESYVLQIAGHEKLLGDGYKFTKTPLRAGVVNRILFYQGSFNPPHLGHLALIQHIYWNSGKDQNYLTAVVLPADQKILDEKQPPNHGQIIMTKEERASLWRGHDTINGFWIYTGSFKEWLAFFHQVRRAAGYDGFELEVSIMVGPDHLPDLQKYPALGKWGYTEWLFSDIARDYTDRSQVPEYEPFQPHVINCEKDEKTAEKVASFVTAGMRMVAPKSFDDMLQSGKTDSIFCVNYFYGRITGFNSDPNMKEQMVRDIVAKSKGTILEGLISRRLDNPDSLLRFIPKPTTESIPRISSSDIRKTIMTSPRDELETNLRGTALNPDLLAEILKKNYSEYLSPQ
ncbi:hypothetical protein N7493_009987 [Penicillium malachiteum]|uniref:Cytidyltransferase-like domain-containing protein n=1 Tax=Penicillium malachiteum TaxID=1324776 RepID=A0AAD6HDX3_9EURO|nr:hypothetical protein N7493_009987 [Penicillium malachiteum]